MNGLDSTSLSNIGNLEILAKQVVEGFITGLHKSPFHGFSVEFAEHRLYNKGESTRHIDWKLYAKTEKLFVKRYEEETNLRSHIIIDNSASMHYPLMKEMDLRHYNKIGFAAFATAALLEILKRQRDAFGLSIYSDANEYYAPARGNEKHRRMLLEQLQRLLDERSTRVTNTYEVLHEIAEKIHRRSLIFLFTDMFQSDKKEEELFAALRHLRYNKHEVVLFHTYDGAHELNFDFDDPVAEAVYGRPSPKNWDDTDAFRIGAAYAFNDAFTGMLGFAVDSNPVPEEALGFELPDSDVLLFSIGGRYKINEKAEFGLGLLYDYKDSRKVTNATAAQIDGEFENAAAFLLSAGFSYKF